MGYLERVGVRQVLRTPFPGECGSRRRGTEQSEQLWINVGEMRDMESGKKLRGNFTLDFHIRSLLGTPPHGHVVYQCLAHLLGSFKSLSSMESYQSCERASL